MTQDTVPQTKQGDHITPEQAISILTSVGYTKDEAELVQRMTQYVTSLPGITPLGSPQRAAIQDGASQIMMAIGSIVVTRKIQYHINDIIPKSKDDDDDLYDFVS